MTIFKNINESDKQKLRLSGIIQADQFHQLIQLYIS